MAGFAGLLAAVPVRTTELWKHLAAGRELVRTEAPSGTWLFDLAVYLSEGLAGGWGLAAGKIGVVILTAAVAARAAGGGLVPAACVTLAVLACGTRMTLSPNTVSLLLLAVLVSRLRSAAPRWLLVGLVLVWANTDRWVWLGVGVAVLTVLGRAWDRHRAGETSAAGRAAVTGLLLAVAAVASPAVVGGWAGLFDFGGGGRLSARSPFVADYRKAFAESPAGLAYFPLLVLSAGSFLLVRWRWERALPWALLAGLSAAQARLIPAFAVLAGPVAAWNLAERIGGRVPSGAARTAAGLAAATLLVSAWPGWLSGPPHEARRLGVDLPVAVERAAAAVGALPTPGRTLHLSPDTLYGFAWFLPGEAGVLADPGRDDVSRFLNGDGADRAVLFAPDPARITPAAKLLAATDPRALVHLGGGAAVFARSPGGAAIDLDRLGFVSAAEPAPPPPAGWQTPFTRTRTFWSPQRGEATVLGLLADAAGPAGEAQKLFDWEAIQVAGLVAAGPVGPADLAVRLTLFRPPVTADGGPMTAGAAEVFGLHQRFGAGRDDVPPGLAYAAVRAARRAVTADPGDAAAHHLLGEAYLRLLGGTRERVWAVEVAPLAELRRVQAVAALERAVALSPRRTASHARLGRLYLDTNCLDLALVHVRAAGERPDDLAAEVASRRKRVAEDAGKGRLLDRATLAMRAGLIGDARDLLLGSDVAAFGVTGMELELTLLARTGRIADVLAWTTPDKASALGPERYHWLRADAAAAAGDYQLAAAELAELTTDPIPTAVWGRVVGSQVLGEVMGGERLPHLAWRAVSRSDFELTLARLVQHETGRAAVLAVRGLLALEAGDLPRARRLFQEARGAGSPRDAGQRIGRDGLGWLGEP